VPRLLATILNEANIAGVLTFDEARRIAVNVARVWHLHTL
jgi:hypothetical protein